jgi:hypothetical protein
MNHVWLKNILLCSILLSIGLLLSVFVKHGFQRAETRKDTPRQTLNKLPDDVEKVQEGFRYSEVNGGVQVDISGKRMLRRGRKVLGLRSTLVKTNFFQDITGTLHTRKNTLTFSASKAEWDTLATGPFILRNDIVVSLNGQAIPRISRARIYFQQGLLEVTTGRKNIYHLD